MLPAETIIEVIATKNNKNYKKEMTIEQWHKYKKVKGFEYAVYQLGFSSYKL